MFVESCLYIWLVSHCKVTKNDSELFEHIITFFFNSTEKAEGIDVEHVIVTSELYIFLLYILKANCGTNRLYQSW